MGSQKQRILIPDDESLMPEHASHIIFTNKFAESVDIERAQVYYYE